MEPLSKDYLTRYIDLTDEIEKKIDRHAKRYHLEPKICAWYRDWEDFCYDWCTVCGYTRTEARKILHGGKGEFMILPERKGIIRFIL